MYIKNKPDAARPRGISKKERGVVINMKNHIFSILILVILNVVLISPLALADIGTYTVEVSDAAGSPGDTKVVTVSLTGGSGTINGLGVSAFDMQLTWDQGTLSIDSMAYGSLTASGWLGLTTNPLNTGTATIGMATGTPLSDGATGTIAVISFTVIGGAQPGDYNIDIPSAEINAATVLPGNITNGTFTIFGPATKLVCIQGPSGVIEAGSILTPNPIIQIQDDSGNVIDDDLTQIQALIPPGPIATLNGTTTLTAQDGVVTFDDLSINEAGANYILAFTATGLSNAATMQFTIIAGSATQLIITGEPSGSIASGATLADLAVEIRDSSNNLVDDDTTDVSVAITLPGGATLGGTTTLQAVDGLVTFNDLNIDLAGTYTLTVTSVPALTAAESSSFDIAAAVTPPAAPDSLTVTVQASRTDAILIWTDNADNETGFEIERTGGGPAQTFTISVPDTVTYADNSLTAGIIYQYEVRAVNAGGNSNYTSSVSTPIAAPDSGTTIEGDVLTLPVLANDLPGGVTFDGDPSDPANGSAAINGTDIIYSVTTPSFTGDDIFTYTITDGNNGYAIGTVTVTVTGMVTVDVKTNGVVRLTDSQGPHDLSGANIPSRSYPAGALIDLEAMGDAQLTFVKWGGDLSGNTNPLAGVVVNSNMTIIAYFNDNSVEYHVDPNIGVDDPADPNGGSALNPFATIGHAVNYLIAGETLIVGAGTYTGNILIGTDVQGQPGNLITIEASGGAVIINGGGMDYGMTIEGQYILLKGFEFINADHNGLVIEGSNIIIESCKAHGNGLLGSSGFMVDGGTNVTFKQCAAYDNTTASPTGADGFHIINSTGVAVDTCVSYNNDGDGIDIGGSTDVLVHKSVSYDNTLNGFVIADSDASIIRQNIAFGNDIGFWMGGSASGAGSLYNNVAYNNIGRGFDVTDEITDGILINNIADNNGSDDAFAAGTPLRVNYNYWGDGGFVSGHDANSLSDATAVNAEPGFNNPDTPSVVTDTSRSNFAHARGFALKSNSDCVNVGDSLCTIAAGGISGLVVTVDTFSTEEPSRYFAVGDTVWIEGEAAVIQDITVFDVTLDALSGDAVDGSTIDIVNVSEGIDMGAYERTACPWNFDPELWGDAMHFYPITGIAQIKDGLGGHIHLQEGDWVGVFDGPDPLTDNCYGATQYTAGENYLMSVHVYDDSFAAPLPGFNEGEQLYFMVYTAGQTIRAISYDPTSLVPNDPKPIAYPDVADYVAADPDIVDLFEVDEQEIQLEAGKWNFISFYIRPEWPNTEKAFETITDHLLMVSNHASSFEWLPPDTKVAGNLDNVSAYESYYIRVDANCTLTISGLRVPRPYTFTNVQAGGWCSISYLYDGETNAIDSGVGIFKDIIGDFIWAKGHSANWCSPTAGDMPVAPGKGIYIKMVPSPSITGNEGVPFE